MQRLSYLLLVAVLLPSGCAIYNDELLDKARGVDGGVGGLSGVGGAVSLSGGTGGTSLPGTGGQISTSGGSGGSASGGVGGSGGATGSGGMGVGGMVGECDPAIGTTGAFTGVSSSRLLDGFNESWNNIDDGITYDGSWLMNNDGRGTGAHPNGGDWTYRQDACLEAGNRSMNVTGSDYTGYGIGFDANLYLSSASDDLSAFTGVAFWARSSKMNRIRIGVSDEDDTNGDGSVQTSTIPLTNGWKEYKIRWPAAADLTTVTVVHLVVGLASAPSDNDIDTWIDDLTFYTAE